jgi:hypothetical protein
VSWNWESQSWKKSNKLLVLFATIWPVIYMMLFFGFFVSMVFVSERAKDRGLNICARIDVLQLDRKIRAGEIKQLKVRQFDVIATDRSQNCNFQTWIRDDSTIKELLSDAKEVVNGAPRVDQITEEKEGPIPEPFAIGSGLGFLVLMLLHSATILLMLASMPFYIILAVNNQRLDQTWKIVWVVLFCTVGLFAQPVYWFRHVLPKLPAGESGSPLVESHA